MRTPIHSILLAASLALAAASLSAAHAQGEKAMTNARLDELIKRLDDKSRGRPGYWTLTIDEREVLVITDERADRMRIISGVAKADQLPPELLYRLM